MTTVSFVIALAALGLAGVAYWRSGGARDVSRLEAGLRRELSDLWARQSELVDHAGRSLGAAYDRSRSRIAAARHRLHRLHEVSVDGLELQLRRAGQQLDALSDRLEVAAGSARRATVAAARSTERSIARRVRRVQARVLLLEVKANALLARRSAAAGAFDEADARLAEAGDLLTDVRAVIGDDDAFDEQLDAVRESLRDAVVAVRRQAEDLRRRIDEVLVDTDLVVSMLETEEHRQASHDGPPASVAG